MTVYLWGPAAYHMLKHFLDAKRWTFEDGKHACRLLFHGDVYVICPGDVQKWHQEVEQFFKQHAYTSELGIDWWYEPVAIRHRGITRGMIFKVDEWLYEKVLKS